VTASQQVKTVGVIGGDFVKSSPAQAASSQLGIWSSFLHEICCWTVTFPRAFEFNPVATNDSLQKGQPAAGSTIAHFDGGALMKQLNQIVIAVLVLGLGFTALAQGQRGMRNYDPSADTTVKGTIGNVQQQAGKNAGQGTHLLLKTDSGTLPVHVGPSAYIAKKQFSFSKGDEIKVLGSKVSVGGKGTLLAREITKGSKTLVLRDAQGIPEWAGTRGQN
jgi:hypothetical protein